MGYINLKQKCIDLKFLIESSRGLSNFSNEDGNIVARVGHICIESLPCRAI